MARQRRCGSISPSGPSRRAQHGILDGASATWARAPARRGQQCNKRQSNRRHQAQQRRPAEDNLASAKVKGINGGHGAVATKPQGLRDEGNDASAREWQHLCDTGHGTIAIGDGDNVITTRASTLQLVQKRAQAYDHGPGAFLTSVATGCVQCRAHHRWYHFNGESIEFVN